MLKIDDLNVQVDGKDILKNLSLDIDVKPREFFVLFGPNGCGKSSLFRTIMGFNQYRVKSGDISLDGKSILKMNIEERVREGIGYMYQSTPKIKGVKLRDIVEEQMENISDYDLVKKDLNDLEVKDFYERDINVGLSGGESKREELFTLSLLKNPKVFLFDEPDSGVDVDNLKILGGYMTELLERNKGIGIVVTHSGGLLKYINHTKGAVIYDGRIACLGSSEKILQCISKDGYRSCVNCNGKRI